MLGDKKIAELKPTFFSKLVSKTEKKSANWDDFGDWIYNEFMKEYSQRFADYLITGNYDTPDYYQLFETKRTDYTFSLLNPEE